MPLEHQIVYQKNSMKTHDLRSWPCVTGKQKAELEEDHDQFTGGECNYGLGKVV